MDQGFLSKKALLFGLFLSLVGLSKDLEGSYPSKSIHEQLFNAASDGDSNLVDKLIKAGADVNFKKFTGETPLHKAAYGNHDAVVSRLIKEGALFNAVNDSGLTPLHVAARRNSDHAARALIDAGANKDAVNRFGRTPLHMAAEGDRFEVAKILLRAGANADAEDKDGNTPYDILEDTQHKMIALLSGEGERSGGGYGETAAAPSATGGDFYGGYDYGARRSEESGAAAGAGASESYYGERAASPPPSAAPAAAVSRDFYGGYGYEEPAAAPSATGVESYSGYGYGYDRGAEEPGAAAGAAASESYYGRRSDSPPPPSAASAAAVSRDIYGGYGYGYDRGAEEPGAAAGAGGGGYSGEYGGHGAAAALVEEIPTRFHEFKDPEDDLDSDMYRFKRLIPEHKNIILYQTETNKEVSGDRPTEIGRLLRALWCIKDEDMYQPMDKKLLIKSLVLRVGLWWSRLSAAEKNELFSNLLNSYLDFENDKRSLRVFERSDYQQNLYYGGLRKVLVDFANSHANETSSGMDASLYEQSRVLDYYTVPAEDRGSRLVKEGFIDPLFRGGGR